MRLPKLFGLLCLLSALVLLSACAATSGQRNKLEQLQYNWTGAIRWGDFEGALNLMDPDEREKHTPTALQLERYRQVQISSYRDIGASMDLEAGRAIRDIEIGVINRHTMAERTVRYREVWLWDPEAKNWWVTSPLPDLWDGQ